MAFEVGGGNKYKPKPQMNVTPLVDVVLVLLIIFMVITPMLAKQFWLRVPEPSPPDGEPDPSSVVVTMDPRGGLRLNDRPMTQPQLVERVRTLMSTRTERLVFFDAADDAPFGQAVECMDQLRGAGAALIAVSPEPIASGQG